jgi:mRNA interferase RelE/StbE
MSYVVEYTRKAEKFLDRLPQEDRAMILRKVDSIKANPLPHLKRLHGNAFWRLRIADYRAILDVIVRGKRIIVLRIGHRKDVYDTETRPAR